MTVTNVIVGAVGESNALVTAKVSGTSIQLAVSTDPAIDQPTFFGPVTPTAEGIAEIQASGLTEDTQYYYAVEEDGVRDTTFTGAFRTTPLTDTAASFTFVASGDAGNNPDHPGVGAVLDPNRLSNAPVFDTLRSVAANPLFFIHLGDLTYYNLGSGEVGTGTVADYRRQIDDVLLQPRQHELYRTIPLVYIWDDHDFGPNNSDGTLATKANAAQVYRERVPSYNLPGPNAIYHSWQVGRVLFMVWDVRYNRSPSSDPDDENKTMLGAEQKQWLRNTLSSTSAEALVVISPVHWTLNTSDDESWGSYSTERQEILDAFEADGWTGRMIMLCADRHAILMDSGANNPWGGFPVYGFASLDAGAHAIQSDWTFDIGMSAAREQYGIIEVSDTTDVITFTAKGVRGSAIQFQHDYVITLDTGPAPPPPPPTPPPSLAVSQTRVTWYGCNLVGGSVIAELPEITGEISRVLGEYTSSNLHHPLPTAESPGALPLELLRRATAPGKTMIVAVVNNVPSWVGIVVRRKGGSAGELSLACVTPEAYLDRRFVPTLSFNDVDEAFIASNLIETTQVDGLGFAEDVIATGFLRDRGYSHDEDATVYQRLTELSNVIDGIEWTVDVDWANENENAVTLIARIRDHIGRDEEKPIVVWDSRGYSEASYEYDESYAEGDGANYITTYGSGEGEDRPESDPASDIEPGFPRWEERYSPSTSIKRKSTLNSHAQRRLNSVKHGTNLVTIDTLWDAYPELNIHWELGDEPIGWELYSSWHPDGFVGQGRVIGWKLNMQEATVRPIVVERESNG